MNIYDDRMEFVSLGGLVKGITLTDIMGGVSQSRNAVIADVFYRLGLIESCGTGIRRIVESYAGCSVQPTFAPAPASFVVTLPNINHKTPVIHAAAPAAVSDADKVLALFASAESITRKDVEQVLQSSSFPATKLLNKLLNEGKIVRVGSARATRYALKK